MYLNVKDASEIQSKTALVIFIAKNKSNTSQMLLEFLLKMENIIQQFMFIDSGKLNFKGQSDF